MRIHVVEIFCPKVADHQNTNDRSLVPPFLVCRVLLLLRDCGPCCRQFFIRNGSHVWPCFVLMWMTKPQGFLCGRMGMLN